MPGRVLPLLALLFFCSGVCALIYQVMWLRMLSLIFGVTVYAASTVLASFMGGVALGSFAAGRLSGRLRSPLAVFGLVEIGVGISALLTPWLLDLMKVAWVAVYPSLPSSLWALTTARFVASFAVLLVPTTLMGATLPIVMHSALVQSRTMAARIGLLYAINTSGAIVGALVAGFYLIAEIGVARSFQIAAALNVAIGVIALLAARGRVPAASDSAKDHVEAPTSSAHGLTPPQRQAVLIALVLSGAVTLTLEIVWFRALVTQLRPTAYAFTIMLAAVLAGIAIGSALATALLRRMPPSLRLLTVVQLAIALAAVLSLNPISYAPRLTAWLGPLLASAEIDAYLGPLLAASLLAMLPTTLLLGFAFPIALAAWADHAEGAARRIGTVYALNVCGAIAGSLLGGFVLLPALGSRGSLIAAAAAALGSAVLLAVRQWRHQPNFAGFIAIVGPVAFVMAALNAANPYAALTDSASERVLWHKEGVQTTVGVHESLGPRPHRIMYLDGMHQASDRPAMAFVHHRIGAFPVLLHRDPKDALVVGLGGGATAGALAQYPGVSVDVVELSHAVIEGAALFSHINFDVLSRPNVTLRVEDGRNFLMTTKKRYDIITADAILPRTAGAASLYSQEYFTLVRDALKDDGIALQWNGGEGATYHLILRTFMSVFPDTTLWADGTLMVGTKKPLRVSRSAFEQRRRDPAFRRLFDWDYDAVLRTYLAGPQDLAGWIGDGPVLSDDRPVIEYFLSAPDHRDVPDLRALNARLEDVSEP